MKRKRSVKRSIGTIAFYLVLLAITMVVLFPIYWMILTSIQPREEIMRAPPLFYTTHPTLQYWGAVIDTKLSALFNSLVIATASTIIAIVTGFSAGYSFARYRVGGNSLPFWILSIKFLPPIVSIIPFFLLMQSLGLIDTAIAVIIPHLTIVIPFSVWMMRGFIGEVPRELDESAMIDGCSLAGVLRRIVLPLIAPGIVVTALFCFIYSWNEFLFALILTRVKMSTLPVVISGMREAHGLMWGEVSALATIATLPILIMAIVMQKYLVRGLALGAVKG